MDKNTRWAEIPQLKGAAFSDPMYQDDVWCQYRRDFNPSCGWVMRMETTRDDMGIVEFALSLGRPTVMSGLSVIDNGESTSIKHYKHHAIENYDVEIDSARVFIGSHHNFEKWGEEASIQTGADGLFGELHVISCKGEDEPAGFLLGGIDGDVTNEDELFRTVTAGFDGHEIDKARFEQLTNPNDLVMRLELAKEVRRANALEKPEKPDKPQPEKGKGDPER